MEVYCDFRRLRDFHLTWHNLYLVVLVASMPSILFHYTLVPAEHDELNLIKNPTQTE